MTTLDLPEYPDRTQASPRSWASDLAHLIPRQPDWFETAACAGHHDIFVASGRGNINKRLDEARNICMQCSHRSACLAYALKLSSKTPGMWAGFTEAQLRRPRERHGAYRCSLLSTLDPTLHSDSEETTTLH